MTRPRFTATLEPMTQFDVARSTPCGRGASRQLRLAAVRDAAFYTWRFLEAPAQREPRT